MALRRGNGKCIAPVGRSSDREDLRLVPGADGGSCLPQKLISAAARMVRVAGDLSTAVKAVQVCSGPIIHREVIRCLCHAEVIIHCTEIRTDLDTANGAAGVSGSSKTSVTLTSRRDVLVDLDVGVVECSVEE